MLLVYRRGRPIASIERNRARSLQCPECGSDRVRTEWVDDRFPFTADGQTTELSCRVPLRICGNCESQYLDDEAGTIQDDAARRHLRGEDVVPEVLRRNWNRVADSKA